MIDRVGRLDISFNLIGIDHVQGPQLVELSPDEFSRGLEARVRTQFITARAGTRHMTGSPDAAGVAEAFSIHAEQAGESRAEWEAARDRRVLFGRLPRLADVASVAAFLASERASAMTAAIANVTCGELLD